MCVLSFNAVLYVRKAQPSRSNTDYFLMFSLHILIEDIFIKKINFQIKFLIKQKTFLILMKVYLGSTKHFD